MMRSKLLAELRRDSRQSKASLARELGISEPLAGRYFKDLEQYIIKHTVILDTDKLGYLYRMNFAIKPKRKVKGLLEKSPNVNNLYRIKGGFFAECIFPSISEAYDFYEMLEEYGEVRKYIVIKDVKREEFSDFPRKF